MHAMPKTMICLYPSSYVTHELALRDPAYEAVEVPPYPDYHDDRVESVDYRVVPPWELHSTLVYLPDLPLERVSDVIAALRGVAARNPKPTGRLAGFTQFGWGSDGYPVVALVDSNDLIPLRRQIIEALPADVSAGIAMNHGYIPHITLAYSWVPDAVTIEYDEDIDMVFSDLTIVVGYEGERLSIPFGQTIKTIDPGGNVDATGKAMDPDIVPEGVTTTGHAMKINVSPTVWTAPYIYDLPDSAFLYVEPGGTVVDGKTIPSTLRHFPYRDASGAIDPVHLNTAVKRLESTKGLPGMTETTKTALLDYAEALRDDGDTTDKEGRRLSTAMVTKFTDAIGTLKRLLDWANYSEDDDDSGDAEKATGTFMVVKAADGGDRWVSYSSNGFIDREGEIVSTKALEDAIVLADALGQRGPLMLWHTKGTEIGVCDFQGLEGRFLVESGTFLDTPLAHAAKASLMKHPTPLGVSIGFRHPEDQPGADGVFHNIKIIERSVCPLEAAANPFTAFETLKGGNMDNKQREWFKAILGEDRATEVLARASTATKELEGMFAHKAAAVIAAGDSDAGAGAPTGEPTDTGATGSTPEASAAVAPVEAEAEKTRQLLDGVAGIINDALTPVVVATKATDTVVENLNRVVVALQDTVKDLESKMDAMKAEPPSNAPRIAVMHRPTEADDNVADGDAVKALLAKKGVQPEPDNNPIAPYIADILGKRAV